MNKKRHIRHGGSGTKPYKFIEKAIEIRDSNLKLISKYS